MQADSVAPLRFLLSQRERQLEDLMIGELQHFILELGYGFCFVRRQHRLAPGKKEYFADLLFHHRFLKALVAFDLKTGPFEPEFAGKNELRGPTAGEGSSAGNRQLKSVSQN